MRDKTKTGLGMRRVLILAFEGVRASSNREKKKPFLRVLLVQVRRKEEEKKKGSSVKVFKIKVWNFCMEFSHLLVRKLS